MEILQETFYLNLLEPGKKKILHGTTGCGIVRLANLFYLNTSPGLLTDIIVSVMMSNVGMQFVIYILFKFGGVYADMDYECLEPLDWLHGNKNCCLGLDPPEHNYMFNKSYIISNAFMAVVPKHPFFQCIIKEISKNQSEAQDKLNYVLETTGPYMLSRLYEHYPGKDQIWLIPSELTSPISTIEVQMIIKGKATDTIAKKIEKAYAVHYFFGSWY